MVTCLGFSGSHAGGPTALKVGSGERLLVIAPHPDDETLGAGGLVQRVLARGGHVRVVIVTAGDGFVRAVEGASPGRPARPAQYVAYGERRIEEAEAAVRELGRRVRVDVLGFPDAGLSPLLSAHWKRSAPARSATTGAVDPPYDEAYAPDAPYAGASLRAELVRILRATKPTLVAIPDPLDAHPDHRATGLFALLALGEWTNDGAGSTAAAVPKVLAYLVHWPGWPSGWSKAPGEETRRALLAFPQTLPPRGLERVQLVLGPAEVARKQAALRRYETQREVMDSFLLNFARASEPFTVLTRQELRGAGWVRDLRQATAAAQVAHSR